MPKKGFIFDLDGVIVDTAKYHYLAWKKLAESLGISFSKEDNEQLKGVSRVRSLEKILDWGNVQLTPERFDTLLAEKNEDYLSYIAQMSEKEILPDVQRVLRIIKAHGLPVALGSASKNARRILDEVGLTHAFDAIVDGTRVSKAKPNPEVFLIAADQLGVDPTNCVVIEDAIAGIQAANAAGMYSIGIGKPEVLNEARVVFPDFTQMSDDFLLNLITSS
jgi:beta-phosphoglucomutase